MAPSGPHRAGAGVPQKLLEKIEGLPGEVLVDGVAEDFSGRAGGGGGGGGDGRGEFFL